MADVAPLDRYRHADLTLDDLVETAARLLTRLDVRSEDGRVTEAPDARGVRYYQAIGVVDHPARYDGRRAIYSFRHLLQLLAVKRFQQEGHPLHLIRQALAGCPTAVLEQALGSVMSGLGRARRGEASPVLLPPGMSASRTSAPASAHAASTPSDRTREPVAPVPAPRLAEAAALIAARVAPGVTITIDPAVISDPSGVVARVASVFAPTTSGPARVAPGPTAPAPDAHVVQVD